MLEELLPTVARAVRPSLLGGIQLGGDSDRELIGRVALAALRAQPDAELVEFVRTRLHHEALQTWSFQHQVEAFLAARGLGKGAALPWERSSEGVGRIRFLSDDWEIASAVALRALAKGATFPQAARAATSMPTTLEPAASRPIDVRLDRLPRFGALYALSAFGQVPVYDVRTWDRPYDNAMVRAVVQAVVGASVVDPQRLAEEAAAVLLTTVGEKRRHAFGDTLPDVDVPDPDWTRAAALVPDRALLVAALDHGSEWLAYMAGNILAASPATPGESRALLDVNGAALWAATAAVREQQPNGIANALILDRLAGQLPPGAEHLFKGIERGRIASSVQVQEAIGRGLASQHGRVATAAAALARDLAERGELVPDAVLLTGYDHWVGTETGTRDGVIPPSPRATLLDLLVATGAFGDNRLLSALSDWRHDVRSAAERHLTRP